MQTRAATRGRRCQQVYKPSTHRNLARFQEERISLPGRKSNPGARTLSLQAAPGWGPGHVLRTSRPGGDRCWEVKLLAGSRDQRWDSLPRYLAEPPFRL